MRLTWRLRIWHDLPYRAAAAHGAPGSSIDPAISRLVKQTEDLLNQAKEADDAVGTIEAGKLFELVTPLSWAVDRFGDSEAATRRQVEVATAGLLT